MPEPAREDALKIADVFLKRHLDPPSVKDIGWDEFFRAEAVFQGGSSSDGDNPDNVAVAEERFLFTCRAGSPHPAEFLTINFSSLNR